MAYFLAAGMQAATWLSAGMGEAVFSSRLARTRATKHEAAHAETEAVAEDGRCCMRARCVITDHLTGRRKSLFLGCPLSGYKDSMQGFSGLGVCVFASCDPGRP
jgi:hypothetical protein